MDSCDACSDHNTSRQALCSEDDSFMQSWIEVAAGITCVLSILGSIATAASYLALKEMRHTVREILLHLSIMTLVRSTANIVGLSLNYHKNLCPVIEDSRVSNPSSYNTFHRLCQVQAFFTSYGAVGSTLWTLGLSIYLYYRIVSCNVCVTMRVVRLLYVVCYALPLYVSLWLVLDGWLGYAPWSPTHKGWCATVVVGADGDTHSLELFMTDDIWIILSVVMIAMATFATHTQINNQLRYCLQYNESIVQQFIISLRDTDRKIMILPIIYLLLWVWHLLGNMLYIHIGMDSNNALSNMIMLLSAICDNAQGLVNFILFCVLQGRLWSILVSRLGGCVSCHSLRQLQSHDHDIEQTSRELSDSTIMSSGEWYQTSVNTPL